MNLNNPNRLHRKQEAFFFEHFFVVIMNELFNFQLKKSTLTDETIELIFGENSNNVKSSS